MRGHPRTQEPPSETQVRAVATEFLRLRPWIVAPFFVFALVTLVTFGARPGQVALLAMFGALASGFFFYERWAGRRRLVQGRALLRSLLITVIAISVACAATGAMASPLLPMLFAPCGVGFAAFGRSRSSTALLAVLGVIVVALVAATGLLSGLAVPEGARPIILAAAVLDAAILLRVGVAGLTAAHARTAETLVVAGEEMVRTSRARARAMETLGARVAHEVKNPLAAIRALVEVMLETADERSKKRLSVAAAEVARIEDIVEGYGSLAHPLDVVRRRRVDVGDMLRALVAILEPRAERAGVELRLEDGRHAGTMEPFLLDRDRMKEALLNLLLNAIDATPAPGKVLLSFAIADDGALEIRVADSGSGMDAVTLAKIGTPFFTRREGGTGLGVAHARQVVQQHGGRLDYESAPRRGTTAIIHLPRIAPDATEDDGDRSHL